jgi:hypothetical protein
LNEVRQPAELRQRKPKKGVAQKRKQEGKFKIEYETNDMERAKKIYQRKPTLITKVIIIFLNAFLLPFLKIKLNFYF